MTSAGPGRHGTRFPSGRLVIVLLVASTVLWAVLFFVTLPHLQTLAGGAVPFDLRWSGYSLADAQALLAALGESGRAYYRNPELVLDAIFPALYAASRALALWWLTMPGRLRAGRVAPAWRAALVALPVLEAVLDWGENSGIVIMLGTWPDLSASLVQAASVATQLKLVAAALTELATVVLAVAVFARWRRRRDSPA